MVRCWTLSVPFIRPPLAETRDNLASDQRLSTALSKGPSLHDPSMGLAWISSHTRWKRGAPGADRVTENPNIVPLPAFFADSTDLACDAIIKQRFILSSSPTPRPEWKNYPFRAEKERKIENRVETYEVIFQKFSKIIAALLVRTSVPGRTIARCIMRPRGYTWIKRRLLANQTHVGSLSRWTRARIYIYVGLLTRLLTVRLRGVTQPRSERNNAGVRGFSRRFFVHAIENLTLFY